MNSISTIKIPGSVTGVKSLPGIHQPAEGRFAAVLRSKVDELKFSAHAQSRIKSRNLSMTPQVMEKLNNAVSGAASKGSKDSLILMPNMAFIVNIPNRTVVTAMDGESVRDNVFTNIDSTVIAD